MVSVARPHLLQDTVMPLNPYHMALPRYRLYPNGHEGPLEAFQMFVHKASRKFQAAAGFPDGLFR